MANPPDEDEFPLGLDWRRWTEVALAPHVHVETTARAHHNGPPAATTAAATATTTTTDHDPWHNHERDNTSCVYGPADCSSRAPAQHATAHWDKARKHVLVVDKDDDDHNNNNNNNNDDNDDLEVDDDDDEDDDNDNDDELDEDYDETGHVTGNKLIDPMSKKQPDQQRPLDLSPSSHGALNTTATSVSWDNLTAGSRRKDRGHHRLHGLARQQHDPTTAAAAGGGAGSSNSNNSGHRPTTMQPHSTPPLQPTQRATPLAPAPEGAQRNPATDPQPASHTARCRAKVNARFAELLAILPPPPQNVSVRHKAQVLQYTCSVLEALVARQRALEAEITISSKERLDDWLAKQVICKRTLRDALASTVRLTMSLTGWKYGDVWLPVVRSSSPSRGRRAGGKPAGSNILEDETSVAASTDDTHNISAILPPSLPPQQPPPLQFAVGIVQDGRSRADPLYDFARACEGVVLRPPAGVPGRVYLSQRPEWMSSISAPPNFERAGIARDTGVASCLGLPVIARGRVIAVIAVYDTNSRDYDVRAVELSQTISRAVGEALSSAPCFRGEL